MCQDTHSRVYAKNLLTRSYPTIATRSLQCTIQKRFKRRGVIGLAVLLGFCVTVHAREITVCKQGCEHKVINSAVAAAASGDTVSIGPGTYFENVVISNKNLTVTGLQRGLHSHRRRISRRHAVDQR